MMIRKWASFLDKVLPRFVDVVGVEDVKASFG